MPEEILSPYSPRDAFADYFMYAYIDRVLKDDNIIASMTPESTNILHIVMSGDYSRRNIARMRIENIEGDAKAYGKLKESKWNLKENKRKGLFAPSGKLTWIM